MSAFPDQFTVREQIEEFVTWLNQSVAPHTCYVDTGKPMFRYAAEQAGKRWMRIYTLHLGKETPTPKVITRVPFCYINVDNGFVYKGNGWKRPGRHDQHQYNLTDQASLRRLHQLATIGRAFHHRGLIPDPE